MTNKAKVYAAMLKLTNEDCLLVNQGKLCPCCQMTNKITSKDGNYVYGCECGAEWLGDYKL